MSGERSERRTLHRELSFKDAYLFGIGGMLGAGIYAIIGEAAAMAGAQLWLSLGLAGAVAIITSLTYAELVSTFPDAGGGYEYIKQAFGRTFSLWASVLLLATGVVAAAAISIAFADYVSQLVDWNNRLVIAGIILLVTLFNIWGAGESSWFNIIATLATVGGLACVMIVGLPKWGETDLLAEAPEGVVGVSAGAALAFFSFVGFEDLVKLAEETKEPKKAVPKALVLSSITVTVVYLLVAVAAVSVVSPEELAQTRGPLAAVMRESWGNVGAVGITVVALFATSKTVLTNVMGNSRLAMDVAREHDRLSFFAKVAPKVRTPVRALILIFALTLGFALIGDLGLVASISNTTIFLAYITVNAALIKIRVSRPELESGFRVPLAIKRVPVLPCVSIVLLLALLAANVPNLLDGGLDGGSGESRGEGMGASEKRTAGI